MLDLETLRVIWWGLIGVLLIGFAITDGFDFGTAILLPFVARNEEERKLTLDAIRPFWEGNQVWIIVSAGALFAAWPFVYAVAFSGFYFLILLLLLTMGISRPVSFKYRDKLSNPLWQRTWDWVTFVGGLFPAFIFGVLMANAMLGADFYFDENLRIFYAGSFASLFNPFAWWCGLTSVWMLIVHGGLYLAIKNKNPIRHRALKAVKISAILLIIFFIVGGFWVNNDVAGYRVVSVIDHFGYSNPLGKEIVKEAGAWMFNYGLQPLTMLVPLIGILASFVVILIARSHTRIAFFFSCISITAIISTVGVSMFPFILPSSTHYSSSLLVWDSSSSRLTLLLMLFSVVIFLPLILLYTSWVYWALRGKIDAPDVQHTHDHKLE